MFKLFFSPFGQLRRQDFWIAAACFTIFTIGLNAMARAIGVTTMASFWLYTLAFPVLIYSVYQVCKKRLHHMGHTARPFWIFLFLMIFLWVGLALYFGWGEYFNVMFENEDRHTDEAWIKAQDEILAKSLEKGKPITEKVMLLPAIVFTAWLALAPGNSKDA